MDRRALGVALAIALGAVPTVSRGKAQDAVHVVVPGDTLYALAQRYGTSVQALESTNRLSTSLLRVGARLVLPRDEAAGYRSVTATRGETLADVAARVALLPGTLGSANPGIPHDRDITGAIVLVPPADGVTVTVRSGDTLLGLSLAAGASPAEVARVNDLGQDLALTVGGPLLLPVPVGDGDAPPLGFRDAPPLGYGDAPPVGDGQAPPVGEGDAVPVARVVAPDEPNRSPVEPATRDSRARLRALQGVALRQALAGLSQVRLESASFSAPIAGRISSRFGWRSLSVNGNHYHAGVDLASPTGTAVHAARDGRVVKAGWGGSYGNVVYLDHGDGSQTRYAHMSAIAVRVGDAVRQDDVLGRVGSTGASTGPHLHFELRFDGRAVDPLDYIDAGGS